MPNRIDPTAAAPVIASPAGTPAAPGNARFSQALASRTAAGQLASVSGAPQIPGLTLAQQRALTVANNPSVAAGEPSPSGGPALPTQAGVSQQDMQYAVQFFGTMQIGIATKSLSGAAPGLDQD